MEGHPALEYLVQLLDADGDGAGSKDGAVDGSVTAVTLKIGPQAGEIYGIDRLVVCIEDNAAAVWDGYGAIAAPGLTNGSLLRVVDADGIIQLDLLGGNAMKRTFDWSLLAARSNTRRTTTNSMTIFHVDFFSPLILPNGTFLEWVIRDDVSSLEAHFIAVRGPVYAIPTY